MRSSKSGYLLELRALKYLHVHLLEDSCNPGLKSNAEPPQFFCALATAANYGPNPTHWSLEWAAVHWS